MYILWLALSLSSRPDINLKKYHDLRNTFFREEKQLWVLKVSVALAFVMSLFQC